jgi:HTH-type transcriptional regulator / antitoxin HigA
MIDVQGIQEYRELLDHFQPRQIRSREEADAAHTIIDALTDLPTLTEGQRDFVGLLGELVYNWEEQHEEPITVSPQEVVQSLLLDNGLRQINLVGPVFASRSAVSDFLAGRRPLSYERVRKLSAFFHVSPAVFYTPTREPSAS